MAYIFVMATFLWMLAQVNGTTEVKIGKNLHFVSKHDKEFYIYVSCYKVILNLPKS